MSLSERVAAAESLRSSLSRAEAALTKELRGRRVRILSDFNGQPIGRSRPSLRGHVFTVSHVWTENDGLFVWLNAGPRVRDPIPWADVELVPTPDAEPER